MEKKPTRSAMDGNRPLYDGERQELHFLFPSFVYTFFVAPALTAFSDAFLRSISGAESASHKRAMQASAAIAQSPSTRLLADPKPDAHVPTTKNSPP